MIVFAKIVVAMLSDLVLPRDIQAQLGKYLLSRAKGEGNADPVSNGEYWFSSVIKSKIRDRKAVVFDVGANHGDWTVHFAAGMSDTLTIVLVEPVPETFTQLKRNLANIVSKVRTQPVNVALSDVHGTATMHVDITNPTAGTNSLVLRKASAYGLVQKELDGIALVTGDLLCEKYGIAHIDFIKIDTEGHEYAVLKGFAKMLAQRGIDIIQFEYGGTWIDSKIYLADMFELLQPRGYVLARLHPRCIEVFDAYDQREESFRYSNYVAIRREFMPLFRTLR